VVVDRLSASPESGGRLPTRWEPRSPKARRLPDPLRRSSRVPLDGRPSPSFGSPSGSSADDGTLGPAPTPQLSRSTIRAGACSQCNGFGAILEYDESLVVPYPPFAARRRQSIRGPSRATTTSGAHSLIRKRERSNGQGRGTNNLRTTTTAAALESPRIQGNFPFLKDLEEKRYKQSQSFSPTVSDGEVCPPMFTAQAAAHALNVRSAVLTSHRSRSCRRSTGDWLSEVHSRNSSAHRPDDLKDARDRVTSPRDAPSNSRVEPRSARSPVDRPALGDLCDVKNRRHVR